MFTIIHLESEALLKQLDLHIQPLKGLKYITQKEHHEMALIHGRRATWVTTERALD